jgi:2-hydroxy-3-keto-5-methylthiopentenyl-1-phosphate phosphatase
MRVFCDFDGTISAVDTTDHILTALADPKWRDLEDEWVAGRIDAATCMRAQIALVAGSDAELDARLDEVALDPGFVDFAAWCAQRRVPITVVSDGVDYFIRRILARHGLADLPVVSNRLAGVADARRLEQPFLRRGCAAGSGVCKCDVVKAGGQASRMVFVGDGRSDFCVSGRADVLFAKAALADYAASLGRLFHAYETFHDVTAQLDAMLAERLTAS